MSGSSAAFKLPRSKHFRARRLPPAPSDRREETESTRRLDHSCFRHQATRQTEGTAVVFWRASYDARYQRTTYAIVSTPVRQSLPATTLDKDERALARRGKGSRVDAESHDNGVESSELTRKGLSWGRLTRPGACVPAAGMEMLRGKVGWLLEPEAVCRRLGC